MPSKKKITRTAIVKTALDILRRDGYECVNARNIAQSLRCSTQPIYSEFQNMEGLKAELKKEAEKCYVDTVKQYVASGEFFAYMAYGLGFIRFAKEEKQMFRYLYMCDQHDAGVGLEDINLRNVIDLLTRKYEFPEEVAYRFHYDMTTYAYGLAVMLNTNYIVMSEPQIIERLRTQFVALCRFHGLPDISRK